MGQRFAGRRVFLEESEGAREEVVKLGEGSFTLEREFEELYEIGGGHRAGVVFCDALAGVDDGRFAEDMEIGAAATDESELALVEEIEASGETAFRPERAFYHRLEESVIGINPRHDKTRLRVSDLAEEGGACVFHGGGCESLCPEYERRMANDNSTVTSADLSSYDTDALKGRIGELRRYL